MQVPRHVKLKIAFDRRVITWRSRSELEGKYIVLFVVRLAVWRLAFIRLYGALGEAFRGTSGVGWKGNTRSKDILQSCIT